MTAAGVRLAWLLGCLGCFGWWLLAATATTLSAAEAAQSSARDSLVVRASPWILPSGPLAVTLEQRGVLAGRRLAILLFLDGNQMERVATAADRTQVRLKVPALLPGRHILIARTGSEVARTEFRVISWSWLAGSLLLAGGGIGLVLFLRRRRRHRPRP